MTETRADELARLDVFVGDWEKTADGGGEWEHDFALTYRRAD